MAPVRCGAGPSQTAIVRSLGRAAHPHQERCRAVRSVGDAGAVLPVCVWPRKETRVRAVKGGLERLAGRGRA